ncbi:TsoY family (seleno)protein [Oricola sp.]|uniref:TsoY family (seleno)protein n=1 Tax=Oricola sp. TaxID=1979950 RepID=UPI003BAC432D
MSPQSPSTPYNPLYFLAALGAGGLAVSFFMYIMWMTPHAGQPIPSFTTLVAAFQTGALPMQALIAVSILGIAVFSVLHVRLLIWNFTRFRSWNRSEAAGKLRAGNAETQLMAIPLTLAMSINVGFIVGAVFVPGLWETAELLFPAALVAFAAIGYYAFRLFGDFMSRVLVEGGFECANNNSLAMMLSVFAFAMIGVGFSASAAMSHNHVTSVIGFMGATLFIAAALVFGAVFLVMGFRSMMENRANPETVPTLWIIIPFLTVVGIAVYRMKMALAHNFGVEWLAGDRFAFLVSLFAVQLVFGIVGYAVMRRSRYFETYVSGEGKSSGSYALICPGVALFVFGNFVVNPGLVGLGVLAKFSIAWFAIYVPLVVLQLTTIKVFFRLNSKLLKPAERDPGALVPAE